MNAQIIEKDGRPEWAVIPFEDYRCLLEIAEDSADLRAAREAVAAIAAGEELIPGELVQRLCDGENPLRVWREHRGISTAALALASGIDEAVILGLESGNLGLQADLQERLAAVLRIAADDLDTWSRE